MATKFDVVESRQEEGRRDRALRRVFGAEPNAHLFYEVAKMQQINRRAGTVA